MNDNFAIQLFEGKQVRIVWDAEKEKYYFAVADIVQVLTETVDPRDYIKKMLRRDPELKSKWGTICPPVEMIARERKTKGMKESRQAAKAGGQIAKNTRDDLERQLGHTVISSERASDYIKPIEQRSDEALPFSDD